ncbi:hypothetical protein LWC05_05505 [Acetobacter sicerae]|uniref:Phage protein n=1 Tax=Acetobacter sicerae TaxID=85325 RepID=A0ABS8VWS6_9PROT|nr:hypothetical protein [Acetobacter sicerae]MCE0743347.1 hypothetical protein [Acetobacter sicerae]
MARKSIDRVILGMASSDIRLQALGLAAVGFWVAVIALVRELGSDGHMVFGQGRVPSLADVARIRFSMTETEFKTQLETQRKTELLAWNEVDGLLSFPVELLPDRRTIANRENGKKGGRPPKNSLNEKNDPSQRHLPPMAIQGGKSEMHKTQTETHPETGSPIAKLASNNTLKASASSEPTREEIDAVYKVIGPKAFEAAGYDQARHTGTYVCARQWAADGLKRGLDTAQIERIVLNEIQQIVAREDAAGRTIGGFGYFQKAVAKAIASANPDAPRTVTDHLAQEDWEQAMKEWTRAGGKGEMPKLAAFVARRAA